MLKYCSTGARGAVAAACVLSLALIGPSAAQQQGGAGAGQNRGTSAGPTAGGGRGSGVTNRSGRGAVSGRTASSTRARRGNRGPNRQVTVRGPNRRVTARYGFRGPRRRGGRGVYIGFGYSGGCGFLRHRARITGSPYWWRRYRICRGW
jgi:hypothetical protein